MKKSIRCSKCNMVVDPFSYKCIINTWLDKNNVAWFEYKCPICKEKNVIKQKNWE